MRLCKGCGVIGIGLVALLCASASAEPPPPYVVVFDRGKGGGQGLVGGGADGGFEKVAKELAAWRGAAMIDMGAMLKVGQSQVEALDKVFAWVREMDPEYVAFVVPPERIEDTFVGRVFERATRLDEDPDLDVAIGYITGATPEDALNMVRATRRAEEERDGANADGAKPRKFVAIGHTFREADLGMFALQQQAAMEAYGFQSEAINPIDDSPEWRKNKAQEMRKLDGASLVYLAGHGMGDWCCGVDADDYTGFTLDRAVIVNGACHSASMLLRHDIDPAPPAPQAPMTIKDTPIPAARSLCLKFIKAGAIAQLGSTASSSWMNVALAIPHFFHEGLSVGEALRLSLNEHLARGGVTQVRVLDFDIGKPSPQFLGPEQNPGHVQSLSRVVLIGDPAYRPMGGPIEPKPLPMVAERPHPMGERGEGARAAEDARIPDRDAPIEVLVAKLDQDIQDGFVTLNIVIQRGDEAVGPLIQRLATTRAWQVPKALGAIGDARAIDPLIMALTRDPTPPFSDVTVEALERITKAKPGATPKAWQEWRSKQAEPVK